MKKITALVLTLCFLLLCGCEKSLKDYFDDVKGFFSEKTDDLYDKAQNLGGLISVSKKNGIDSDKIITIKPGKVKTLSDSLCAYDKLNGTQKNLYSVMLTAIESMELKVIDITPYAGSDVFSDAVIAHRAVLCDRPDMFWAPKTFSLLSVEESDDSYLCFKNYEDEDDSVGFFGVSKSRKQEMQAQLDGEVNALLKNAGRYGSAFEKEVYFHDHICENTEYDKDSAENLGSADSNALTAYGALVEGKAICEGYSKAMQLLCLKAGIPCCTVYGEHGGVPHMWNIINPGDGLYYLDVTFDDSSSKAVLHNCFNVTKSYISKDHTFDALFSKSRSYDSSDSFNFFCDDCENTALSFYKKSGAYIDDGYAAALDYISRLNSAGKTQAELKNYTSASLDTVFEHLVRGARGTVDIERCYRFESENILVVVW